MGLGRARAGRKVCVGRCRLCHACGSSSDQQTTVPTRAPLASKKAVDVVDDSVLSLIVVGKHMWVDRAVCHPDSRLQVDSSRCHIDARAFRDCADAKVVIREFCPPLSNLCW